MTCHPEYDEGDCEVIAILPTITSLWVMFIAGIPSVAVDWTSWVIGLAWRLQALSGAAYPGRFIPGRKFL